MLKTVGEKNLGNFICNFLISYYWTSVEDEVLPLIFASLSIFLPFRSFCYQPQPYPDFLWCTLLCFLKWFIGSYVWTHFTVHGMEYGFGALDYSSTGVFEVEPKSCPGFIYKRSVWLGTTEMSPSDFHLFLEHLSGKYRGDTYNLTAKNCNHFTDDVCMQLTGKHIPGWVNRLARLGMNLFWTYFLNLEYGAQYANLSGTFGSFRFFLQLSATSKHSCYNCQTFAGSSMLWWVLETSWCYIFWIYINYEDMILKGLRNSWQMI